MFKSYLLKIIPKPFFKKIQLFKHKFAHDFRRISYSAEAEDILISNYFGGRNLQKNGFYIDIGAHHPFKYSNTYIFYKLGWHGINIDPLPGMKKMFDTIRPRDINLEIAVSEIEEKRTYYEYDNPALNTFDKDLVTKRKATIHISPKHSSTIQTKTINQILDSYASKPISFLSIEVECMEFDILKSWNFKKFRPILICVEIKESNIFNQFYEHKIVKLLMNNGYTFHVQTLSGAIFKTIH